MKKCHAKKIFLLNNCFSNLAISLCIYREINLYQSFYWRFLILCFNNIDILSRCMKKCHAKKIFLLNNCFSNLAILYGLCILDINFLHWPLLQGVSYKLCLLSFFSFVISCGCRQGQFKLFGSVGTDTCWNPDMERLQILLIWQMKNQHFIVLRKLFVAKDAGRVILLLCFQTAILFPRNTTKYTDSWILGSCFFMH